MFNSDGTTPTNVTSFTSSGNLTHGVVVCSSVNGSFVAGETITGGSSGVTAVIQSNAVGLKGVRQFDFSAVKQIGQAGTPGFTADVARSSTYGESLQITGTLSISNSSTSIKVLVLYSILN